MRGRAPSWVMAWEPLFALLNDHVQEMVLPWIPRIERGLGPLRARGQSPRGALDGYEGLTRRSSSYDRLLTQEWLLAMELPEEFERRAALGEHLFHELARSNPHTERRVVVWLDTSPEVLGAPRLGQLAALLVLAHRAALSGAPLVWSLLGGPPSYVAGVTPENLAPWMGARSLRPMTRDVLDAAIEQRRALATQTPDLLEECWVLGGASASAWAQEYGVEVICFEEAFDPGCDALEVTIRRHHSKPQALMLELPPVAAQIGALQRPLRPRDQDRAPSESASIQLSPNGRQLLVCHDGVYYAIGIPSRPWDTPGRVHVPVFEQDPPERVLLASWKGRNFFFLGLDAHQALGMYYGRELGESGPLLPRELPRAWARHALALLEEPDPTWAIIGRGPPTCGNVLATRTSDGRLWAHALSGGALQGEVPHQVDALALCARSTWIASQEHWVSEADSHAFENFRVEWGAFLERTQDREEAWLSSQWSAVWVEHLGVRSFQVPTLEVSDVGVHLGWSREVRSRPFVAVQFCGDVWWLYDEENYIRALYRQPAQTTVHGVYEAERTHGLSLLLLEDDRQTLSLAGVDHVSEVMRAPSRIAELIAQPEHKQFAYITQDGGLGVYSLEHRRHLVERDVSALWGSR